MSRILAKIRDRRWKNDYTELDLYDMDRNPIDISGDNFKPIIKNLCPSMPQHVPYETGPSYGVNETYVETGFEIEEVCYGVMFAGAVFDILDGVGDTRSLVLNPQITHQGGGSGTLAVYTQASYVSGGSGARTHDYDSFASAVLLPGLYDIRSYVYVDHPDLHVHLTQLAMTLMLFPGPRTTLSPAGWEGTGV